MTSEQINDIISDSAAVKRKLAEECSEDILRCGELLAQVALDSGLIMLCGNGGSAADSQHLAAELVVRLRSSVDRRAIGALALTVDEDAPTSRARRPRWKRMVARAMCSSPSARVVTLKT